MIDNVAAALARHGIVVTAAPAFLVREEILERMSMLLWSFFNHLSRTGKIPEWFNIGRKPPQSVRNALYYFPLYKVVYPSIQMPMTMPGRKLDELGAKALKLKPMPDSFEFNTFMTLFWRLNVALTDKNGVLTDYAKYGATYHPAGWVSFPVFADPQFVGAPLNTEKPYPHTQPRTIMHELRHAFSDYHNTPDWNLSEREENTFGDRAYYLRPSEITARMTELISIIRGDVTQKLRDFSLKSADYKKWLQDPRARDQASPYFLVLKHMRREYAESYNQLLRVFGKGEAGFMRYAGHVLKTQFSDLDKVLREPATSTNDLALQYAHRTINDTLSDLYDDMSERYRTVLPRFAQDAPVEQEHYQHTRHAEVA